MRPGGGTRGNVEKPGSPFSVKRPSRGRRRICRLLQQAEQYRTGLLLDGEELAKFILSLLELPFLHLRRCAVSRQLDLNIIGRGTGI